ncbi:MAG: sulfur carrier protein ThiS [bacterium]|nr:sulfur carrier protein ThiS [Candidatus Sumerlaeota bacterium]
MKLQINGQLQEFESIKTLEELLVALNIQRERVAAMVNETVIRRADHASTFIKDGDVVEIITMVGGG